MKVTIGEKGLKYTWQDKFPKTTKCCKCKGKVRIGFVCHEGIEEELLPDFYVCSLHPNDGLKKGGKLWLHDCCAVAVYFCQNYLEPTTLYNQA